MNKGEEITFDEEDLPRVRSLLKALKEKNGEIGGKFILHDIYEPKISDGKIRRFIEHLGDKFKAKFYAGRGYYPSQSLEHAVGLALKVSYTFNGIEQFMWYHCPQTPENIALFDSHLNRMSL